MFDVPIIANIVGGQGDGGSSPTDDYVDYYESTTGELIGQVYHYDDGIQTTRVQYFNI